MLKKVIVTNTIFCNNSY